jgi:hypothetical protein
MWITEAGFPKAVSSQTLPDNRVAARRLPGGKMFFAWVDPKWGSSCVYVRAWLGSGFGTVQHTVNTGDVLHTTFLVAGGNVHVFFNVDDDGYGTQACHTVYFPANDTLVAETQIAGERVGPVGLASNGTVVHAYWVPEGGSAIKRRTLSLSTWEWSETETILTESTGISFLALPAEETSDGNSYGAYSLSSNTVKFFASASTPYSPPPPQPPYHPRAPSISVEQAERVLLVAYEDNGGSMVKTGVSLGVYYVAKNTGDTAAYGASVIIPEPDALQVLLKRTGGYDALGFTPVLGGVRVTLPDMLPAGGNATILVVKPYHEAPPAQPPGQGLPWVPQVPVPEELQRPEFWLGLLIIIIIVVLVTGARRRK